MAKEKKPLNVIVKSTNDCNLKCKYCYASDSSEKGVMTEETLENLITKTLDTSNMIHYIWHGGEPLLAGKEFYEAVVRLQNNRKTNQRIINAVQTNGTLLDEEFIDFFF